jgi:hypothetical protein
MDTMIIRCCSLFDVIPLAALLTLQFEVSWAVASISGFDVKITVSLSSFLLLLLLLQLCLCCFYY